VPIPISPRVVYTQNVLKDALCQMRFPPILAISAGDPAEFQDLVRVAYPLYRKDVSQEFPAEFGAVLSQMGVPHPPSELVRHIFSSADKTRSIFITRDFITIQRTSYTRWNDFGREISEAAAAFVRVYRPAFFERIGLRYRNEINRDAIPGMANAPWDRFVRAELAGPLTSDEIRDDVVTHSSRMSLRFERVPSAMIQLDYGVRKSPQTPAPVYYIEADFYVRKRTEIAHADGILDEFHTGAGNLFRWAISSDLHNALGPIPADQSPRG
jgi:uncharacterized protein (TIGR04255 family)